MRKIALFPKQIFNFFMFTGYYIKEFIKSNFILLIDILRPNTRIAPAIIKLDLPEVSDREIALLSSLISLTPGTLTLSIKASPPALFVHGMFVDDVEEFRTSLESLADRIHKFMRYPENGLERGSDS